MGVTVSPRRFTRSDLLLLCAPLPALTLGVLATRDIGVRAGVWSVNLASGAVGILLFAVLRNAAWRMRSAWFPLAAGSLAFILSTFAFGGIDGVHRWISLGGFGLHASAIAAPLILACVATAPEKGLAIVTGSVTAAVLALQPDAAQTCSFAAGCGVIFVRDPRLSTRERSGGLVALIACSIVSLVRVDPLKPVRHVEGIFEVVSAGGPAWALLGFLALLLLPVPCFLAWAKHRRSLPLALGVYIAMVTIAPAWGTFPVPVMGYGVSPIVGYFIALGSCAGAADRAGPETLVVG